MALPEALLGDRWTEVTARLMFPLLVWCANHGKKITYGQVDEEIQRRGWGNHVFVSKYGHPAGAIGSALLETDQETDEKIPPLNALVVNATTGVPGDGCDYYLSTYPDKRGRKKLSNEQRNSMAEETIEEVFRFRGWDDILLSYGLKQIKGGIPSLQIDIAPKKPRKSGWSTGPETEAHKSLKNWVAKNPRVIKSKISSQAGKTEWLFASSDRADVMFKHADGCVAVEVKTSEAPDQELERGIYQCVKYQALLRAELKAENKAPNGLAVLVIERRIPFPSDLQNLADLLGVRVIPIKPVFDH
jgi:hypothetical protein